MADQASPATQQPPIVETWRLALAVAMFMTASASMLLINKLCMTAFPLEGTVVLIQMGFATVLLPTAFFWTLRFGSWRDARVWASTVPFFFSAMLVTNAAAAKHASVGALTVVRNISPLLSLPIEHLMLEKLFIDVHSVLALVLVVVGVVMYVEADVRSDAIGVVLLLINMGIAIIERLLQRRFIAIKPLDLSKTAMMLLNNGVGMLPQVVILLVLQEPAKYAQVFARARPVDYVVLGVSCMLGLAIGWTAINLQQYISATSLMLVGNVSKVLVIVIGILFMHDSKSPLSIGGAFLAMSGGIYYGFAQYYLAEQRKQEQTAAAAAAAPASSHEGKAEGGLAAAWGNLFAWGAKKGMPQAQPTEVSSLLPDK
jgi:drug/metabolite transporter (DMT)-like permease